MSFFFIKLKITTFSIIINLLKNVDVSFRLTCQLDKKIVLAYIYYTKKTHVIISAKKKQTKQSCFCTIIVAQTLKDRR
jgi:hypothetical protein